MRKRVSVQPEARGLSIETTYLTPGDRLNRPMSGRHHQGRTPHGSPPPPLPLLPRQAVQLDRKDRESRWGSGWHVAIKAPLGPIGGRGGSDAAGATADLVQRGYVGHDT